MKMRIKALCVTMLVLTLGCGSNNSGNHVRPDTSVPEQVIENFNMTNRQSGKVLWELAAAKASIYQNNSVIELASPLMKFYEESIMTSVISGENGTVNQTTKMVELWGNVIVDSKKENTVIKTPRMFYNTELDKIYSNEKVEIQRPGSVTKGLGFESDPGLNVITIKQNETQIENKK